jgi:hypothetical protein
VEKGQRVHTIVAVVLQNVNQTIVGWKDLMAMRVISSDWPTMPRQETEGKIHAADDKEEEKELGKLKIHMQKKKQRIPTPPVVEDHLRGLHWQRTTAFLPPSASAR